MNDERKHLFISVVLGATVICVIIGAVIAIRYSFQKNQPPLAAPASDSSSEPPSSAESSAAMTSSHEASSLPSSSEAEEPASSTAPFSSQEASSQEAVSSEETISSEEAPFVDDSGATAVTLFANGKTHALTPEEITEFMQLYLRVTVEFVRSEDNTELNATSNGGFAVTYQDGRQESYYVGQLYDGTWWSGDNFYEVDANALNVEEYMVRFPLIANWVNGQRAAAAVPEVSEQPGDAA